MQTIPALKSDECAWVQEAKATADLFAVSFNGKNVLPDEVVNAYTSIQRITQQQKVGRPWSESEVCIVLEALDENSGAGPDMVPTRILKYCAKELSVPILKLVRLILFHWRVANLFEGHWITKTCF